MIVEDTDPIKPGSSRYNFELSKIGALRNVLSFSSELSNKGINNKLLNKLYRRKAFLNKHASELGRVLHFTEPEIMFKSKQLNGRKIVLTVHDLAVFGTTEYTNLYWRLRAAAFRRQFVYDTKRADLILVNSSQTKNELIDRLGTDAGKILVTNLGVSSDFKPLRRQVNRVIGYFGGFNPRKRVGRLIEEFRSSKFYRDYELWLAGREDGEYSRLHRMYGNDSKIKFIGGVAEAKLPSLICSFKYLVIPSKYEGFGLPIIESVACGVPTFIYRDAAIPEEVAHYSEKISSLEDIDRIDYSELRGRFLRKSKRVREEFSWERLRTLTLKAYKTLL